MMGPIITPIFVPPPAAGVGVGVGAIVLVGVGAIVGVAVGAQEYTANSAKRVTCAVTVCFVVSTTEPATTTHLLVALS